MKKLIYQKIQEFAVITSQMVILPSLTLEKNLKTSCPRPYPLAAYKKIESNNSHIYCSSTLCESLTVDTSEFPSTSSFSSRDDVYFAVNAALMAKIEMLVSENIALKNKFVTTEKSPLGLEDIYIMHDDHLVKTYTGFPSYKLLIAFFNFLLTILRSEDVSHNHQKNLIPSTVYF